MSWKKLHNKNATHNCTIAISSGGSHNQPYVWITIAPDFFPIQIKERLDISMGEAQHFGYLRLDFSPEGQFKTALKNKYPGVRFAPRFPLPSTVREQRVVEVDVHGRSLILKIPEDWLNAPRTQDVQVRESTPEKGQPVPEVCEPSSEAGQTAVESEIAGDTFGAEPPQTPAEIAKVFDTSDIGSGEVTIVLPEAEANAVAAQLPRRDMAWRSRTVTLEEAKKDEEVFYPKQKWGTKKTLAPLTSAERKYGKVEVPAVQQIKRVIAEVAKEPEPHHRSHEARQTVADEEIKQGKRVGIFNTDTSSVEPPPTWRGKPAEPNKNRTVVVGGESYSLAGGYFMRQGHLCASFDKWERAVMFALMNNFEKILPRADIKSMVKDIDATIGDIRGKLVHTKLQISTVTPPGWRLEERAGEPHA